MPKIAAAITSVIEGHTKMAEVSVSSILLFLLILWAPPVQAYPDGERKVCHNTSCSGEQALLSGGLVFVKLDFNGTAEGALFIGGVPSFWRYSCGVRSQML